MYADSVDATLVDQLDAWYDRAATDADPVPFEVLLSWCKVMPWPNRWTLAGGRVDAPWGPIEGAELAILVGREGMRGRTWSQQLDAIERGDDPERAAQAANERAWAFALRALVPTQLEDANLVYRPLKVRRSVPSAIAPALYVRGLVEAGMGQRQAARYALERERYAAGRQYLDTLAGSRLAQYRRVWVRLGMTPASRHKAA